MTNDEPIRLDPVEARVLGSLLEKEITVPATYPLTLNALRTACNQTSGRDPVMSVSDDDVTAAIDALKANRLARLVHASHGARAVKYRQVITERIDLDDAERAVVTLLLLRGPQTPGELRSRAGRLHEFADLAEVEAALTALAAHEPPLVAELDRRPGQKERRWAHLLGDTPPESGAFPSTGEPAAHADGPPAARSATETLLRDGVEARDRRVTGFYDTLAGVYADHLTGELDAKPFDRWLLERIAELADDGPVAEVGCGPGHIAFHLAAAGADVTGFDRSGPMIDEARRRFPDVTFEIRDLTDLRLPYPPGHRDDDDAVAAGWSAIVAWYSLVHLTDTELRAAVASLSTRLAPGGLLAVAVHAIDGGGIRRIDTSWVGDIECDVALHDPTSVIAAFETAGLESIEWYRRGRVPGVEIDTERCYVIGRRG